MKCFKVFDCIYKCLKVRLTGKCIRLSTFYGFDQVLTPLFLLSVFIIWINLQACEQCYEEICSGSLTDDCAKNEAKAVIEATNLC